MNRFIPFILSVIFIIYTPLITWAQTDSTTVQDSTYHTDSLPIEMEEKVPTVQVEEQVDVRYDGLVKEDSIDYKTAEFYILLIILFAFGALRLLDSQLYSSLFSKFLNTNLSVRPVKNVFQQVKSSNYLLISMFYIIAGLYIFYILEKWQAHPAFIESFSDALQMLFYIGCITAAYIVKLSFLGLIGYIFNMKKYSSEYTYNILLVQQVLGIMLYPFLWVIIFMGDNVTKFSIILSIVLFALAFLNRYARSRESIMSLLKLNKFHFFIYLCTSEIIPLLIIIKIMIN